MEGNGNLKQKYCLLDSLYYECIKSDGKMEQISSMVTNSLSIIIADVSMFIALIPIIGAVLAFVGTLIFLILFLIFVVFASRRQKKNIDESIVIRNVKLKLFEEIDHYENSNEEEQQCTVTTVEKR
ncbi:hypothetical protein [Butyrivibrio sp.]|uniref:hypothetical protein n=1 Tax=Butyrivibrio sp. TaxID=28121 RepID=UPI0025C1A3DE|nr:hypothetical protein [Butyrivibrio sp.]MBQ9305043.1 hypothetical protein [Butyrivibrio sp.]